MFPKTVYEKFGFTEYFNTVMFSEGQRTHNI